MHSKFPWTNHPHTPTAVFDGDGRRIIDQWVAPDDWQDIETAPRDGTRILATGGGLEEEIEVVSYNDSVGAWDTKEWTLDDTDDGPDGYNRPTRWMPLPVPPSNAPAPTPLDPETAAANAVMIAAIPALIAALESFAAVAENDIGDSESNADYFQPMRGHNRAPQITVGDLRRAAAALASIGRTL